MARVVATRVLPGGWLDLLARDHEVVVSGDLGSALPGVEALVCQLTECVDDACMQRAPSLRVIGNMAVGVDNIDVGAATARRIAVVNTPGVLTAATADLTMALLLAAARRIVESDAFVRSGQWRGFDADLLVGSDLGGKRLGIVGLGRIGTAVARRAAAFGMEIVYTSRTLHPDAPAAARHLSLDDLLQTSDFVTLHAPATAETHHLIDAAALRRMKRTAILINVSRGPLVDEAALARALADGVIAGAALDVFEREPAVHAELLAAGSRVVLTPHVGSATRHTRAEMARLVCEGVAAVLRGDRPANVVNPEVLP